MSQSAPVARPHCSSISISLEDVVSLTAVGDRVVDRVEVRRSRTARFARPRGSRGSARRAPRTRPRAGPAPRRMNARASCCKAASWGLRRMSTGHSCGVRHGRVGRSLGRRAPGGVNRCRTLFQGGRVFDGTGAAPADGDVVIEDGRIVEVGRRSRRRRGHRLQRARRCSPACSTATSTSRSDTRTSTSTGSCTEPFSYPSTGRPRTCGSRSRGASPPSGTRPAPTRALRRRWTRAPSSVPACRSRSRCSP